jgi:hypothetical protein
MRMLLIVVALILGVSGTARADGAAFMTGYALLQHCQSKVSIDEGICLGFIMGVSDAMSRNEVDGNRSCRAISVTVGQTSSIVIAWIDKYPEKWHFSASFLAAKAMSEAFPCK